MIAPRQYLRGNHSAVKAQLFAEKGQSVKFADLVIAFARARTIPKIQRGQCNAPDLDEGYDEMVPPHLVGFIAISAYTPPVAKQALHPPSSLANHGIFPRLRHPAFFHDSPVFRTLIGSSRPLRLLVTYVCTFRYPDTATDDIAACATSVPNRTSNACSRTVC